ncbi:hypothetical protein [Ferrimicrobium sp.]|jgi:hypothetical protein|uniref:hypothetical protein n=1 Tax=Ferrimicrobium sp. TaxID=2926050 RepID=UPI00260B3EC4|nr:hypothetical protein [Ferrimicrobium sp.]
MVSTWLQSNRSNFYPVGSYKRGILMPSIALLFVGRFDVGRHFHNAFSYLVLHEFFNGYRMLAV